MNIVYYFYYIGPSECRQVLFTAPNGTTKDTVLNLVLKESFALLPLLEMEEDVLQTFGVTKQKMEQIIEELADEVKEMEEAPPNIMGPVPFGSKVLFTMMDSLLPKLPQKKKKERKKRGRPKTLMAASHEEEKEKMPEEPPLSRWTRSGLTGIVTGLIAIKEGQTPEGRGVVVIEAITVNSNLRDGYGRKMMGTVKAMFPPNLAKILCVHPNNKDALIAYRNNVWLKVTDKAELESYAAFRPTGPSKSMLILKCA